MAGAGSWLRIRPETLDQQPVSQAAVAHRHPVLPEHVHDRAHDARPGEDHVGALGLEPDDRATGVCVARPILLDLPVDVPTLEDRPVDGVWVVGVEAELHGRDVRDRTPHRNQGVGRRSALEAMEVGRDRVEGRLEGVGRHGRVEPEALGVTHGADIDAEAVLDLGATTEGELGASSTRVEDHEGAVGQPEVRSDGDKCEPALLLPRDGVDGDAGRRLDRGHDLVPIAGRAQPGRSHCDDRPGVMLRCLLDHAGDRRRRSLHRGRRDRSRLGQPVSEPGRLGPIDDRPPGSVAGLLADVELDRVRAHIDHRVSKGFVDEGGQPARHARVHAIPHSQCRDRGRQRGGILGLNGERAGAAAIDLDVGQLAHAVVDRVADASLVDGHDQDRSAGLDELAEKLGQRVGGAGQAREGLVKRLEDGRHISDAEREARLEDGLPPFEAIAIGLAKHLDVDELGSDLDVVTVLGQQVELVTLLDRPRCQAGQHRLRRAERRPERPPLPARDDRRQPQHLSRSLRRWRQPSLRGTNMGRPATAPTSRSRKTRPLGQTIGRLGDGLRSIAPGASTHAVCDSKVLGTPNQMGSGGSLGGPPAGAVTMRRGPRPQTQRPSPRPRTSIECLPSSATWSRSAGCGGRRSERRTSAGLVSWPCPMAQGSSMGPAVRATPGDSGRRRCTSPSERAEPARRSVRHVWLPPEAGTACRQCCDRAVRPTTMLPRLVSVRLLPQARSGHVKRPIFSALSCDQNARRRGIDVRAGPTMAA